MDSRRDFIKKASLLAGGGTVLHSFPSAIAKAFAIDPLPGSTYLDAEHIVFLMQENRSFDHTYGTLQGVRGFNDPRAIQLPNKNLVWLQSTKEGNTYAPFRLDIKNTKATWMDSLPHSWANQVDARNNGKYDQWLEHKKSGVQEYEHMPLTLGYYTREDIPFYYSLADAFTICDQHFCSSLTGTTPNRLYFWTGTIRERQDEDAQANVWNQDADYETMVSWQSFPERLEKNGVSWKVYQNELGVGVGFEGEEDAWLSNFGDNPLEYLKQYHVKLSAAYIANLPKAAIQLSEEISKEEEKLKSLPAGSPDSEKSTKRIDALKKYLAVNKKDQEFYTKEKYDSLSSYEKNLHDKAFVTNLGDPDYHKLTTLNYKDKSSDRTVNIPKGDTLHQFRKDVAEKKLPTVSWLVAPQNFSDHPSSAWYGAWYISEVMDILTKDPEVWKKTIFILTYDENDGYFDHVPPFVAPHPHKADTGRCSSGINTNVEYVTSEAQQSDKEHARNSPIGLGYRVPLVIASPWSRGGWVCSEVFDHTSSLQFLENFFLKKTGKNIREENISEWRRTVCGDLTSSFRPYNGEKIKKPVFLDKNKFIESIHQAQFKKEPDNFKKLTAEEIAALNKNPRSSVKMAAQEKGTRPSCGLSYELYAEGKLTEDKKTFEIQFHSGNQYLQGSAGSPFQVYAPGNYQGELVRVWDYAVKAGDSIKDAWRLENFDHSQYQLRVYAPNGFYREFKGDRNDPDVNINAGYQESTTGEKKFTGNILLTIENKVAAPIAIEIIDNAYKTARRELTIVPENGKSIVYDLSKSGSWYDFTIRIKGSKQYSRRYAGRVETGAPGKTDPAMGRTI